MTKPILTLLLACAISASAQQPAPAPDGIKLVAAGRISRFDKLRKGFELAAVKDKDKGVNRSGDFSIGIGVNTGRLPPTDNRMPTDALPEYLTTTVFLTDLTICKDGNKVILCGDLKTSDNVRVTGYERREARGKGLYATDIIRTN